ncbi:MFS transporter [Mycolicibacterium gilvum]|uniref:MFS transporter n=1 Tax=Mycolicibacterium gilvum TaxID=1804 RepID=UPI001FD2FF88|nr:MFS transporter [Mycolicibacterium gilvum]
MAVASFLVLLDDTAVAIALPSIGRELGLGLSGLEWVINIYTVPFAVLTLAGGLLTDRFGARPVFLGGVAAFTVVSVLAGFSSTGAMLLGMRAAQGAAAALIAPSALTLLITSFSGARRGFALGVWSGVGAAALAVGPLLGALLTDAFGWQSIFFLNLPTGVAMLILAYAALPRPRPARRPLRAPVDVVGLIASAIGLFALVLALTQTNSLGWTSIRLWAMLAIAAASAAIFVVAERRSAAPLVDLSLFRIPNVAAANVLALLNLAVMCSVFFFLSLYLQLVTGFSPTRAGLVLLPMTVLIAVLAPLAGWLVSHVGARPDRCGHGAGGDGVGAAGRRRSRVGNVAAAARAAHRRSGPRAGHDPDHHRRDAAGARRALRHRQRDAERLPDGGALVGCDGDGGGGGRPLARRPRAIGRRRHRVHDRHRHGFLGQRRPGGRRRRARHRRDPRAEPSHLHPAAESPMT